MCELKTRKTHQLKILVTDFLTRQLLSIKTKPFTNHAVFVIFFQTGKSNKLVILFLPCTGILDLYFLWYFFLSITASDLSEWDKNPWVNFLPMINQVWMPMLGVYRKLPLTCHGELKIRLYLQHKACDSSSAVIQSLSPLHTLDMGIQLEVLLQVNSSWEHLLGLKPANKVQRITGKYI